MADLLYRLGKLSAARPWTVIISWIVLLALAVGAFVTFSTPLSASVNIPGTKASEVLDELAEELPEFSGGSGLVLYTTDSGEPFTAEQRSEISAVAAGAKDLAHVTDVVDPFEADAEIASQREALERGPDLIEEGRTELSTGQARINEARQRIEEGLAALDAGQGELDAAREQLEAFGQPTDMLEAQQTEIDAQRQEVEAGLVELDSQQEQLDAGLLELDEAERELAIGTELLDLANGIGTVSPDGTTALVNVSFDIPAIELAADDKQTVIDYVEAHPVDGVTMSVSQEIAVVSSNVVYGSAGGR